MARRVVGPQQVGEAIREAVHAGLLESAHLLERKILVLLSQKGTGRWYRTHDGSLIGGEGKIVKFRIRRGRNKGSPVTFAAKSLAGLAPHQASSPGQPPAPDTGTLRGSIRVLDTTNGRRLRVRVGTGVKYAPFLERGRRFMAPRPFMRPAFTLAKNGMKRAMRESGAKAAVILKNKFPPRKVREQRGV